MKSAFACPEGVLQAKRPSEVYGHTVLHETPNGDLLLPSPIISLLRREHWDSNPTVVQGICVDSHQ